MNRLPNRLTDEAGFTLTELLTTITIGIVVMLGIFTVLDATTRSTNRTTERVIANQAARPALSRIIDELNSSCIFPGVAPVKPESTGRSISFVHSTGSAVSPVPVLRKVELVGSTLWDRFYARALNSPPAPGWTFDATARSFEVAENVFGSPADADPIFRYFKYDTAGNLVAIPLTSPTTPLGAAEAATVVAVDVAFRVKPRKTTSTSDLNGPVSLSDTALLRFSPAGATTNENLPCV